ncbi:MULTISPECIES: TonB-dependent receptor domain-containing protein [Sphingomonas]|uniref:TonB-dependent receptor domain-containing protein n=1 Tax=Sphingomonas TaxID=13687 RepID=UPI00070128FB|nr:MULTISPECIES: TonB-dependent receptor [Sphingomonas]KQM99745.1 TonB-dependent receptor [Sphingomonas sp. Leaf226]MDY0965846.1 TonB-dependent receptor [Sphingomonas sp. CFBP9021]USQ99498.1 TonB-dependent receptor [Sphingomonas aerolata]
MSKRRAYGTLLLLTSTLVAPAALAQTAPAPAAPPRPAATPQAEADQTNAATPGTTAQEQTTQQATPQAAPEAGVEVSSPGYDAAAGEDIVVVGRNIPNTVRATAQIVSVLSSADIARTGEGDIAGALTRVTGLSVVGGGFVYVRGLGDRYSSSLLNGSPLPSPEPLRRSVPLDIFPTAIVGSALVQKTYSVNYPGEFGGGVINLTTKAIPEKNFLSIGGSISADTVTTSELGYTYYGGDADWIGFDDGARKVPAFIKNAPGGTGIIPTDQVAQLTNANTTLLQRNNQLPANWSGELSGGSVFDFGSDRLGIIASLSASNTFRTRSSTQQDSVSTDGTLRNDFQTLLTDNRIVTNALIGLGYEFGPNTIRSTTVYIHDTLKQARGSSATVYNNSSGLRFQQNTNWFERQLFESQLVGEFKLTDALKFDARGAYANSKRNAPYERQFDYLCSATTTTGLPISVEAPNGSDGAQCNGAYQVTQRFTPFASIIFSELNEDLYTGQGDLSYKLDSERPMTLSTGYFYSDTKRNSTRLQFNYQTAAGGGTAPGYPYNLLRPDYLLGIDSLNANQIQLQFSTPLGAYAYDASLRIHAGYVQAEAEATDGVRATIGVRYETAEEQVTPIGTTTTRLKNDYFLPAATLTYNFANNMQLRASASKTISRPQFRELAPQQFRDPESDRLFFGNPLLKDSELYNLEGRYEWFFARDQRFTLGGFYKEIKNPVEQVGFYTGADDRLQTGFTNLPEATLYGAEVELQKYFDLDFLNSDFFATRRALFIANYTYSKSSITADNSCVPNVLNQTLGGCQAGFGPASLQFRDGASLTGQSDHLVNVQVGLEDTASLSAITLLFNYASNRVTNRGPSNLSGVGFQPDIIEKPGIRLDLVARQGFELVGGKWELKAEARNLTGTRFQEGQTFDNGAQVFINRYNLGRVFTLGLSTTF